jgi:hypothetical protein
MWQVHNDFGPVEDFDNEADARAFAKKEGDDHYVVCVRPTWLGETRLNSNGYPKG